MRLHASTASGNLEPGSVLLIALVLDATGSLAESSHSPDAWPVELEYLACCVAGAWRAESRWTRPNVHRTRPVATAAEPAVDLNNEATTDTASAKWSALLPSEGPTWFCDWESQPLEPDVLDGGIEAEKSAPWLAALWDLMEAVGYPVRSVMNASLSDTSTHKGLIFASRACCVARLIRLDSPQLLAFCVQGRLPSTLPPSFDGKYVRYRFGVGVVAQLRGRAPMKLHLPLRIRPRLALTSRFTNNTLWSPARSAEQTDARSNGRSCRGVAAAAAAAAAETKASEQTQSERLLESRSAPFGALSVDGVALFDAISLRGGSDASLVAAGWHPSPPLVPQMSPSWSERRASSPCMLALSPSMHQTAALSNPQQPIPSSSLETGYVAGQSEGSTATFPLRMDLDAAQVPVEISTNLESILSATSNGRLTAYPTTAPNEWDESSSSTLSVKMNVLVAPSERSFNAALDQRFSGSPLAREPSATSNQPSSVQLERSVPRWTPFSLRVEAAGMGHVATVHLERNCFALGESVPICVDWSLAEHACVYIRGTLESVEILHPRHASTQAASLVEAKKSTAPKKQIRAPGHRRRYRERAEPCVGLHSWQWAPVLPEEEDTPVSFTTRAVQLQWMVRIQFLLPKREFASTYEQREEEWRQTPLTLVTLQIPLHVGGALLSSPAVATETLL
ncbi:hypothetical protein CCYA_CCYA15G4011 [Cyanidiococcus yangmingshanensis]|nr:hypothetical protein CCYA_CCYA15G4011 [Cyanidiococcus yangmingshanensis]